VKPEVRSLREAAVDKTAIVTRSDVPAITPEPTPPTAPAPPAAAQQTIQESLPSLDQLRTAGLVSIDSLHIDMHVYSTNAAKRFVFINMKKYREGERLAEGPTIEAITADGIIMIQQGTRFQMSKD
jgi:general secretion pathway protein B